METIAYLGAQLSQRNTLLSFPISVLLNHKLDLKPSGLRTNWILDQQVDLQILTKMQGFSTASIPSEALVEGKLYAMLLFARNAWGYGVFNGAAGFRLSDTQIIPLEYRQTAFNYRQVYMWMARMGPAEFDVHPVLFYPVTYNVETMVHTWREARRLQEWEEDGVGDWKITPLRRMGWTLIEHLRAQTYARRRYAIAAWAAVLAAAADE